MSELWSAIVRVLTPYVPGEQPANGDIIKLNTNENPYGPSPKALAAIRGQTADSLRLYPDPAATALKTALAEFHALTPRQVFVGNGSDEVLAHIFQGLLKQDDPILFPDITYSFYPVYCALYDVAYATVPLSRDFEIELGRYERNNGGIIFANPFIGKEGWVVNGWWNNRQRVEQQVEFDRIDIGVDFLVIAHRG